MVGGKIGCQEKVHWLICLSWAKHTLIHLKIFLVLMWSIGSLHLMQGEFNNKRSSFKIYANCSMKPVIAIAYIVSAAIKSITVKWKGYIL